MTSPRKKKGVHPYRRIFLPFFNENNYSYASSGEFDRSSTPGIKLFTKVSAVSSIAS